MIKRVLVVSMVGLSLVGCVNNDTLSGDVYTASEAKQVQNVSYGTIVNVRPVQIQGGDDSNVIGAIGGAVLGGFLGNTVGGGTGRSLATAAGAVAGGVAGQGVQSAMNKTQGVELEIRKDDGNTIMVVQKQGNTRFSPGQRVVLASNGQSGDRFSALNKFACGQVTDHTPPSFHPLACNSMILCSSFAMSVISCSSSSAEMPCNISARVLLITASISLISGSAFSVSLIRLARRSLAQV
ncbi:Outer membrane lipoprotein pcp precursor [Escherichia coli EC4100B]|nr:Outer membrane lipoprotein pcp precursor [Escherichia coli EC4100B]